MAGEKEFMAYLRAELTESAASTFTETEIDTGLSTDRGVVMEIHQVEFDFSCLQLAELSANGEEYVGMHVTKDSQSDILNVNDTELISKYEYSIFRSVAIGTDAGPLWYDKERPIVFTFPKPIPYVKPTIWIGLKGSDATAKNTGRVRIGYTLSKVSKSDFVELLVAAC